MSDQKILLESICDEVDQRLVKGELIDSRQLTEYVGGLSSEYRDFAREYVSLTNRHYAEIDKLRSSETRQLVHGISDMDLNRTFWNALWGGIAGGSVGNNAYTTVAGALVGLGMTVVDEFAKTKANLAYPFWGVVLGAILGGDYVSEYVGAAIGGGLGLAKTLAGVIKKKNREGHRNRELQLDVSDLEADFAVNRSNLLDNYMKRLLEAKTS
ncbi:hypothetical protein J4216_05400 [Candidatus Woesearchaeota archaeon]|nr:hypothetical protein [Candidatus Woesearchaeota archaeon]